MSVDVSQRADDGRELFESEVSASRLADTIFGEPGSDWYSTVDCTPDGPNPAYFDPDDVTRFGLAAEDCPSTSRSGALVLELDKLRDLAHGKLDAEPSNDHMDYEEARISLGLDASLQDFHLRSWPILPDLERNLDLGYEDPNQHVAYLGDYATIVNGVPTSFVVSKACGRTDGASQVEVWVDIYNNGTVTTVFEVVFAVPLSTHTIEIRKHTSLVPALTTMRVSTLLPKSADWEWAGTPEVSITVNDIIRSLGGCTVSLSGLTMTAGSNVPIYTTHSESLQKVLSGSTNVKVYYEAYDGSGHRSTPSGWNLLIETAVGLPLATDANLNNRGWESFSLATAGNHIIKLKSSTGSVLAQNTLNLVAASLSPFTPLGAGTISYEPMSAVVPEANFLAALVEDFTPSASAVTYNNLLLPYAVGGDVYPVLNTAVSAELTPQLVDNKGTLDPADDTATLANYNVIVVGSGADHSELNSVIFKTALRDWVNAGGTLVVLGSAAQTEQWLDLIFLSALATAGSGLTTPDPAHPMLHSPNALDYLSYTTGSVEWSFEYDTDAEYFTHVISSATGGDALAISEPGTMGEGTVILTTYQPWNLRGAGSTGDCDPAALEGSCEALKLVHNLLTMSYRELYVDFGPELPSGTRIASVTRVGILPHRDLDRDIELLIQIHVF